MIYEQALNTPSINISIVDACLRNPELWRDNYKKPSWFPYKNKANHEVRYYRDPRTELWLPYECAIAYVQSSKSSGGTGTSNITAAISTTTGNFLAIGIVTSGAGTSVTSIVLPSGGTATRRSGRTFLAGVGGSEIWEVPNITGNVAETVTANYSGTVSSDIIVAEYSGVKTTSPFDVQNTASGTSTTPSSGTAATNQADELLIGYVSHGANNFTAGSGYTVRQNGTFKSELQDRIVSSTGTYASDGTLSASAAWTMCFATFKGTGAAAATVKTLAALGVG